MLNTANSSENQAPGLDGDRSAGPPASPPLTRREALGDRRSAPAGSARPARPGHWRSLTAATALLVTVGAVVATHRPVDVIDTVSSAGSFSTVLTTTDTRPVEVGTRYRAPVAQTVRGISLYASAKEPGPLTATIWDRQGAKLATAETTASGAAGWRYAPLSAPVRFAAGETYVISYFAPFGQVAYLPVSWTGPHADGSRRSVGVYRWGAGFPTERNRRSVNYLVSASVVPATPAPTVTPTPPPTSTPPAPSVTPSVTATPPPTSSVAPPATTPAAGGGPTRTSKCLSDPGACGFPDASSTGYRHTGVQLTDYTGPLTITKAGTVIDGKLIKGQLVIRASDVTVKRSKVVFPREFCSGFCGGVSFLAGSGGLIEDVEVDGNGGVCFAAVELGIPNAVARRIDAHDCGDGFRAGENDTIEDSYVHDVWQGTFDGKQADTPHNDGIQSIGDSHMTFVHNTLLILDYHSPYTNVGPNAAFQIGAEYGSPTDVTIKDNLVDGGGYVIRIPKVATRFVIEGNRFGRGYYYGPFIANGATGYTWSGNVWDDTGAPVSK